MQGPAATVGPKVGPLLIVLALLAPLTGCAAAASRLPLQSGRSTTSLELATTAPPMPPTPHTPIYAAPLYPPYSPVVGEPEPEAKRLAANLVQALTTYDRGSGTLERAMHITAEFGADPAVADAAGVLLSDEEASGGEILYPQLGGVTTTGASVMVVFRQHLRGPAGPRQVTRTADVRLARTASGWAVTALASVGDAGAPTSAAPTAAGAAVLADPRIELPDTARWDILAGRVDDRVLALLSATATKHRLSVTTLVSGHPVEVFDTERMSNHTRGRAVDIWAVDGTPVVAHRDAPEDLLGVLRQASALGVTEMGSPWQLELPGSFTDVVHQDHLHLGFKAT